MIIINIIIKWYNIFDIDNMDFLMQSKSLFTFVFVLIYP